MSRVHLRLADALDALIDHRGKTPRKLGGDWSLTGHRVLSAINIKDNRIDENDHHYVSDELYRKWMKEPLRAGDVLLTSEAPTGEVAYVDHDQAWCLGQRLFGLRGKRCLLDGRYLFYMLRGGEVRHQLMSRATGTTVSGIRQSELVKIEVALPPLAEQRGIAATLGVLDDKIESNRRAVHLEVELAIACLSSGESSVRVGDVATLAKGLSYKGSGLNDGADPGAVPMFNLGNFTRCGQLKPDGLKFYTGDSKQTHRLSEGELLIANTDLTQARELLGRGFLVPPTLTGAIHTHHTSVARFSDRPWLAVCLWAQLQTSNFRERAMGFATGTTVTALPSEAVLDFELRVPARGEDKVNEAMPLLRHA